jgi:hypothetical protein
VRLKPEKLCPAGPILEDASLVATRHDTMLSAPGEN